MQPPLRGTTYLYKYTFTGNFSDFYVFRLAKQG